MAKNCSKCECETLELMADYPENCKCGHPVNVHFAEVQATIETMVDSFGLDRVLTMLEDICFDKAEHIAVNWQDASTARLWEHAARTIGKVQTGL